MPFFFISYQCFTLDSGTVYISDIILCYRERHLGLEVTTAEVGLFALGAMELCVCVITAQGWNSTPVGTQLMLGVNNEAGSGGGVCVCVYV